MPASKPGDHGRHSSGIQLDEDHCFQHRMWRIERIGWWGIVAVVLAAAAGLFGHGPLRQATLHVADSITPSPGMCLDYERFGRAHGESQMRLTGPPDRIDDGTFSVWFSREYLGEVEVWSNVAQTWLDGKPTIIVEQGRPKDETMKRARVDEHEPRVKHKDWNGWIRSSMRCWRRAAESPSSQGDHRPLTILPLSASTRRSRDSFPVSMISTS